MNNVFRFYIFNNKLKNKLRTGWGDVEISASRIESISEHIYGCLILAICINSEYKLNLNMEKILKMLTLHELEEIIIPDYSALATISSEEKMEMGHKAVKKIVQGLIAEEEIMSLIEEFDERQTKESKFCNHIDKLEADFQAKMYDLAGVFDFEKAADDCRKWCGEKANSIIVNSQTASDIWLGSDHYLYDDDEIFSALQECLHNITKDDYDKIINDIEID